MDNNNNNTTLMDYFPVSKRTRNQLKPKHALNDQDLPTSSDHESGPNLHHKLLKPSARLAALKAKAQRTQPLPPRPILKRSRVVLEEEDEDVPISRPCTPPRSSSPLPKTDLPVISTQSPRANAILCLDRKPAVPSVQAPKQGVSSLKSRLLALKSQLKPSPKSPRSTSILNPVSPPTKHIMTTTPPRSTLPHLIDLYGNGPVTPIQSKLPRVLVSPSLKSTSPPKPIQTYNEQVPMPKSLTHLIAIFQTLESMTAITLTRPEDPLVLEKAKQAIEIQSHREINMVILSQLVGLFPEAYTIKHTRVRDRSGLDKVVDSVIIEINLNWNTRNHSVPNESLLHRAVRFHQYDKPDRLAELMCRCIALVNSQYQKWLAEQDLTWDRCVDQPSAHWHPLFDVDKLVLDLPQATLPTGKTTMNICSPCKSGVLNHPVHLQYQSDRLAVKELVDTQLKTYMTTNNVTTTTTDLSIVQRHAILTAKIKIRESVVAKLGQTTYQVQVSKLVHVAQVVLKYLRMENKSVIALNHLADKVQTSLALLAGNKIYTSNKNADACSSLELLCRLVPKVFEIQQVAGIKCFVKVAGNSGGMNELQLVREAIQCENRRVAIDGP